MATKLFNRKNAADVFDRITEDTKESDTDLPGDDGTDGVESSDLDESDERATDAGDGDTATADDEQPDTADEQPATQKIRRRWPRRVAIGAAGAIAVAAVAASAFFGWQYKQHTDVANARQAALATAESYAATLTSMDSEHIDDNVANVLDGATGEFKDMYSQSAAQLRQVLIDNKAMSKGVVVDSAVKSATEDKVDVLLFIDQSITNVANPEPRLDRSRVAMTMDLVDGRWLASNVELK